MRGYDEYKSMVEEYLGNFFSVKGMPQQLLLDAMAYSVLAGGKRLRPVLCLAFCEAAGGDAWDALPAACALELLHTYSLIHDDLPCMDNDDLRRGKPTSHKVYGDCVATLAGDALQAEAFGMTLRCELPADRRAALAEALAAAAGVDGICGGQLLDTQAAGRQLNEDELSEINSRKTGSLITAACRMGVIAAGGTDEQLEAASFYGAYVGTAFQIRDDMLDVLGTLEQLGKPIGSDAAGGKTTFMSLYGEVRCRKMVERLSSAAVGTLDCFGERELLSRLALKLVERAN